MHCSGNSVLYAGAAPDEWEGYMTAAEQPTVLTVDQVAHRLGVSRDTVYRAAKRGEVPSIRVGRRLLVPADAFERLMRGEWTGER